MKVVEETASKFSFLFVFFFLGGGVICLCGKKNYVQNAKKSVSRSCLSDVIPGQQQETPVKGQEA